MSLLTLEYITKRLKNNQLDIFFNNDSALINEYISEANYEVDFYLIQRYKYPYEYENTYQSLVENVIIQKKMTVFLYRMYARKYDNEAMKETLENYRTVISNLRGIVKGNEKITGLIEMANPTEPIRTEYRKKVFDKCTLKKYDNRIA